MADHKTEKYHRINLFLDKGFIRLAREVVQKHVVNSTPLCYNQNPWRLEDFLFQNQSAIFRYPNGKPRNLLEGQKLLLIPTPPNKPNLEHWDITLLCFVLTELCQISKPDKDDIIVIQKIRNEICHTTDASLSDREYADYSKTIKAVIGRFLVWLNDANITQEINDIIKDIEDGPLTHLQELLRQVEEWQNSERGLATAVNNLSLVTTTGFAEQDKKYDKLIEKMQTLIDLNGRNLQPPDTKIKMRVINCENEDYLCDKLVAILKSENQTDDQLERPLKNAMSKLIKEEMKIISVKKECVAIVLCCHSFESLHRLWTTCVNGEATILFKPVEQCLRYLPGCENVELKVGVTTEELLRCVETMVSEIEEDTVRQEPTCTVTVMHSLQEKELRSLQKSEHTTFAFPKSVESGPQPGKEGIVIQIVIKPTTFEHVMHTLESFESTEFTKELQSISSMLQKKLKIADVDVKATLDNEKELKEALDDAPWRDIGYFKLDRRGFISLKDDIKAFKPQAPVPQINIAIVGPIQAGKSSFINTIDSAFKGYVDDKADVLSGMDATTSVTSKYTKYKISEEDGQSTTAFRHFCLSDTRGIMHMNDTTYGLYSLNFNYLLKGHIREGYKFDTNQVIPQDNEFYRHQPKLQDQMHCICFVLNGNTVESLPKTDFQTIAQFLQKIQKEQDLRYVVLVTHMDMVCPHVKKDTSNMYTSRKVEEIMNFVADELDISLGSIVPIVNYSDQTETSASINVTSFLALRQLLRNGNAVIDNKLFVS